MPLVLKVDEFTNWLEHKISVTKIQQVISTLEFYPVSKAVNNPQNDGQELIKAVG